jgi:hypothetical protein
MPDATTTQDTAPPTPIQQAASALAGPQPTPQPGNAGATPAPQPWQNAPAQPTPQQQAAAADTQHHSMLGKLTAALLGKQTEYSVDPQTGKTIATAVPEKPGDLFRHILAGALLGGAAAKGQRSALGGFAAGGKAGLESSQQMDQQKQAHAQQQYQNQQAAQRQSREEDAASDEHMKTTAQLEMWNKEQLLHDRESNLREQEFHENHNNANQLIRDSVSKSGGIDASIQNNGETGNGAKYERLFVSHPEMFQAPKGYNRVITKDINFDGVKWDAKQGYVDESGKPVDLASRTAWHVQFVPQATRPIEMTYGQLYKQAPHAMGSIPKGIDPNAVVTLPVDGLVGIMAKESELDRQEKDEAYKRTHDDIRADMDELKSKANNFTRQADEAERQGDAATAKQLRQQATDAFDEYDEVKQQAHPQSRLRKSDSGRAGTVDTATLQAKIPGQLRPNEVAIFDKQGNFMGAGIQDSPEVKGYVKQGYIAVAPKGTSTTSQNDQGNPANVAPYMTVMKNAQGKTVNVLNSDVKNWTNQGYSVVGQGTSTGPAAQSNEHEMEK